MEKKPDLKEAVDAAAKVIIEGAQALGRLENVVRSDAFETAVRLLYECEGVIYIIGIGKSGLVGKKIAATLTSTGAPANYIHAGDALHGDMGSIRPMDAVLLISKSGQTKEVIHIIPFLKMQKNRIIAITNEPDSTMAEGADVVLPMLVVNEGCPLNLAPMTSSTATMALGDAIAGALIVASGFTKEHFVKYHPGGRLGFLLTAKVSDMIASGTNPVAKRSDTLRDAVIKLVESKLGGVSVVDEEGKLAGVLTDGDLKRIVVSGNNDQFEHPVEEVMCAGPTVINLDASAAEAVEIMENRESQLSILPVVDENNRPVGILRLHDIIRKHL